MNLIGRGRDRYRPVMTRRFLIDTDTASDDAVALIMALRNPELTVEAITVVAGNVPLEQGVQNALYVVDLCRSEVPVYAGASQPLSIPLETAEETHGFDGMGDVGLLLSGREPADGDAIDVIIDTFDRWGPELTLVSLGPLTNVAKVLERRPDLASICSRFVMMGGVGDGRGNVTPVSEYNLWADPHAADMVFRSRIPITMVGWDISYKYAVFDTDDQAAIRALGTDLASFAVDIQAVLEDFSNRETKISGFDLPDPIAMAVAIEPSIATRVERLFVGIETEGRWSRGQTVVDHLRNTGEVPNTDVVLEASREGFLRLLHQSLV